MPGPDDHDRERPGAGEAAHQSAREHEQHDAGATRHEMRDLGEGQRQQVLQRPHALPVVGQRAGGEQHQPAEEGERGERHGDERLRQLAGPPGSIAGTRSRVVQLADGEQHHRHGERRERVGEPPDQRGGQQLGGRSVRRGQQQRGLERAQPRRHMAGDGEQDGRGEDGREDRERQPGFRRQQHPQRRGGGADIEQPEPDLPQGDTPAGDADLRSPCPERPVAVTRPPDEAAEGEQEAGPENAVRPGREMIESGQGERIDDRAEPHHGADAEPERQAADGGQLGHFGEGQARPAIDAPANRARGEQRKAERVTDRVARERAHGDGAGGQPFVGRGAQRKGVIADEGQVADGAEREGDADELNRRGHGARPDRAEVEPAGEVDQQPADRGKRGRREQEPDGRPGAPGSGASPSCGTTTAGEGAADAVGAESRERTRRRSGSGAASSAAALRRE